MKEYPVSLEIHTTDRHYQPLPPAVAAEPSLRLDPTVLELGLKAGSNLRSPQRPPHTAVTSFQLARDGHLYKYCSA